MTIPTTRRPAETLALSSVDFRVFPDRERYVVPAHHAGIAAELLPPGSGDVVRNRTSFRDLTAGLVGEMAVAGRPLDLVVLAHDEPDLHTPEIAGCRLADACPGEPVAFSVSDQGVGAAFTALLLADGMCRAGDLGAGAVFVVDRALLWDTPERDDSVVLLRLDNTADPVEAAVVEPVVVEPVVVEPVVVESVTAEVLAEDVDPLADLVAGIEADPSGRLVVGAALASTSPGVGHPRIVRARARLGITGVWAALASAWPTDGRVVVADFDTSTRRRYTCTLRPRKGRS